MKQKIAFIAFTVCFFTPISPCISACFPRVPCLLRCLLAVESHHVGLVESGEIHGLHAVDRLPEAFLAHLEASKPGKLRTWCQTRNFMTKHCKCNTCVFTKVQCSSALCQMCFMNICLARTSTFSLMNHYTSLLSNAEFIEKGSLSTQLHHPKQEKIELKTVNSSNIIKTILQHFCSRIFRCTWTRKHQVDLVVSCIFS